MKSRLSWILLAIYLNASAQTLLPFVQDCFAHLFFWKEHLEHVHNGQIHSHHVAAEMAAEARQGDQQHPVGSSASIFDKNTLSTHLAPCLQERAHHALRLMVLPNMFWLFSYQSVSGEVFFPPPRL